MTQDEFVRSLAKRADLSRVRTEKLLSAFSRAVNDQIKAKKSVSIKGLGTFRGEIQKSRSIPDLKEKGRKLILFERQVPKLHFSDTFRKLNKSIQSTDQATPIPQVETPASPSKKESQTIPVIVTSLKSFPTPKPLYKQTIHAPSAHPAAHLVDAIIKRALRSRVRFIHFNPVGNLIEIAFRTDGELKKVAALRSDLKPSPIEFFKVLAKLDPDSALPQSGRFRMTIDGSEVDFVVSTLPMLEGEKIAIRLLPHTSELLSLDQIGLRDTHQTAVKKILARPNGTFAVSSPRRAGQTTTLYALILAARASKKNLITIEDPVERPLTGVFQSQVDHEAGFSFFDGLKAAALQDADLVMVGSIESTATANLSLKIGLHHHLILAGLVADSSISALIAIKNLTGDPMLVTTGLAGILNQRTVRRACTSCQKPVNLSIEEELKIKKEIKFLPPELKTYQKRPLEFKVGSGCKACAYTGYKGEIGLFELFQFSEDLKDFFLHSADRKRLEEEMVLAGQISLKQDGILKALDGLTTLEEVWRVTN